MIAVHCGAGKYNAKSAKNYKQLMKKACRKGLNILKKENGTAIDAVVAAIEVLENDPLTNAGFGSNLTINGTVECDAAVMNGKNLIFGACGAVENVKNPICLAYDIYKNQLKELPLGLVQPNILVGNGAYEQAKTSGLKVINGKELISNKSLKTYTKYKQQLDEAMEYLQQEQSNKFPNERLDTVGAVCIDNFGNVASGSSSGGILLKHSGRVGQTVHYGSGVWADTIDIDTKQFGFACCTTGCGEQIMQTFLAKTIADDLIQLKNHCPTTELHECLLKKFINSKVLKNTKIKKICGALVLLVDYSTGIVSLLWGHSSTSMAVAYMELQNEPNNRQKSHISILPDDAKEGESVNVGGTEFYFRKEN